MGAVLSGPLGPVEYFGIPLDNTDTSRFSAREGGPAFNTLREALAILIALRAWAPHFTQRAPPPLGIRSGNQGALGALEISPGEAIGAHPSRALTRMPGVANVRAGALLRLFAPQPNVVPAVCQHVPRARPPPRSGGFYRTVRSARSALSSSPPSEL
eukprot:331321-Alexandrium_andersonii.AAC.1